jgi:hypothetical protein
MEEVTFICQTLSLKLTDFGLTLERGSVATIPKNLAQNSKQFMDSLKQGLIKVLSNSNSANATVPPVVKPLPPVVISQNKNKDYKLRHKQSNREPAPTKSSVTIVNESSISDKHITDLKYCISQENESVKERLNMVENLFSNLTQKIDKSLAEIQFIKESLKTDLNVEIKDVINEVIFPIQKTLKQLSSVFDMDAVDVIDKKKVFETVQVVVSECLRSMSSIDYIKIEDIIDKTIQKNMENSNVKKTFSIPEEMKSTVAPLSELKLETFIPGNFKTSEMVSTGLDSNSGNGISKTVKKKPGRPQQ